MEAKALSKVRLARSQPFLNKFRRVNTKILQDEAEQDGGELQRMPLNDPRPKITTYRSSFSKWAFFSVHFPFQSM
jgi:hypothetical protein